MPCQMPSREELIARIDYDPSTGSMTWRTRPASMFGTQARADAWNRKCAGRPAFPEIDREGYARGEINIGGVRHRVRAHRVAFKILTGLEPLMVDHRDGDVSNNRGWNLRAADDFSNRWNSRGRAGRDLPKGVYRSKNRFVARATFRGQRLGFGTYASVEAAHAAYLTGVAPLHGKFSRGVFA